MSKLVGYTYTFIPEEWGGYSAGILEFEGCYSEGETIQEALANLEAVAESWISCAVEDGQDIPPPSGILSFHGGRHLWK